MDGMKKYSAVLATAAVSLLALTVTPAVADHNDPADEPSNPGGGFVAWYNDIHHWGTIVHPKEAECYALDPALTEGGAIANFTRYKATFYADKGCAGTPGPVLGPHDAARGVSSGARSVILIPADAIPTKPAPKPGPKDNN